MKSNFNLATSPLENNRRFIAGSGLLGLVALVALVWLSLHAYRTWSANRELRGEISRLTAEISRYQRQQNDLRKEFKDKNTAEIVNRAAFLNGLIAERTFPWIKIFSDLEHILPPGVRVISITPHRDKEGNVKVALTIGAMDDEAKLKFLQSLEAAPSFSDVEVSSETRPTKANANGSGDSVLLALDARYSTI
jgi:Tfp pilus assembly protein PilN